MKFSLFWAARLNAERARAAYLICITIVIRRFKHQVVSLLGRAAESRAADLSRIAIVVNVGPPTHRTRYLATKANVLRCHQPSPYTTASRGGRWHHEGSIPGGCLTLVLYLVDGQQGVASMGGGKAKVLLLAKLLDLQHYVALFPKAAK